MYVYKGEIVFMTLEREPEPEHQHHSLCSPCHLTNTTTGLARVAPQDTPSEYVPFFATEDAFLHAVYANWNYFIRFLMKHYPRLLERERETGSGAPVGSGWYVPLPIPQATRTFDALLGLCDGQDILVDALERCLNPKNAAYYTRYTPRRPDGCHVQFTTWFLYHVRSCAGSRLRSWKRGRRREKPLHSTTSSMQKESTPPPIAVDTYITHAFATPEDVAMPNEDRAAATAQHSEPSYDPSRALDARLDLATLMVTLTGPEQTMLKTYLNDGVINKDVQEVLSYTPSQTRSKMSYVLKKMRRNITKGTDK